MQPNRSAAALALLVGLHLPVTAGTQTVKLNDLPTTVPGDVLDHVLSPDGATVVFRALREAEQGTELHAVPIDAGQAPVQLTDVPGSGAPHADYTVSLDGTQAVFRADAAPGVDGLYRVPIAGGTAVELDGPLVGGVDVSSFRLGPDGTRVVYRAKPVIAGQHELWSVPLLGGAPPVRISGSHGSSGGTSGYEVAPDGSRVAFRATVDGDDRVRVFATPIDGSAPPVDLTPALAPDQGDVLELSVTPDSARVVFRGDLTTDGRTDLYSAPIDGSSPAIRLAAMPPAGAVTSFRTSPDGNWVVYRADQVADEVFELWSVPVDGSGAPRRLNGPLSPGGDVLDGFVVSAGGVVAYRAVQLDSTGTDAYSVPLDASTPPVKLSQPSHSFGIVEEVWITSTRVVYRGRQGASVARELFSAPIDGSTAPVRLNPPLPAGGDVKATELVPGGDRVLFRADAIVDDRHDLFSAPADGSAPAVRLSEIVDPAGDVRDGFLVTPDAQRVVFRADLVQDEVVEVHAVPTDASAPATTLNSPFPLQAFGDVLDFEVAPRGDRVAFRMDAPQGRVRLHGVRNDGAAPAAELGAGLPHGTPLPGYRFTGDGRSVLYLHDPTFFGPTELFVQPADASEPPRQLSDVQLSSGRVTDFAAAPGDEHVVYIAEQQADQVHELLSRALAGSQPPVALSGGLVPGGDVEAFLVAPDGTRVVYLADQDTNDVLELFSVPTDGSAPPVRLNGTLTAGGDVGFPDDSPFRSPLPFAFTPDATRVVYVADQDVDGRHELYSAPIDGSLPATAIQGPLVPGGDLHWMELAAGGRVVYVADQEVDGRHELYSVPADGSLSPVALSGTLPPTADVGFPQAGAFEDPLRITPDGERVVFSADRDVDGAFELFVVPTAGGSAPVKLNEPLAAGRRIVDFRLAPGGLRATYVSDVAAAGVFELYSVPLDASQAPVQLSGPLIAQGDVHDHAVTRDGREVVYLADQERNFLDELYQAPIDGSRPPRRRNGELPVVGDVHGFQLSPDGSLVIYRANQDLPDSSELYAAFLRRPHARAGSPDGPRERNAR